LPQGGRSPIIPLSSSRRWDGQGPANDAPQSFWQEALCGPRPERSLQGHPDLRARAHRADLARTSKAELAAKKKKKAAKTAVKKKTAGKATKKAARKR
jgi:hypothetical protein